MNLLFAETLHEFQKSLFYAERLHVLLNHIPLFGLVFACVPLLMGLIKKNTHTLMSGLLIMFIASGFTPFVMSTGEEAEERFERPPYSTWLHNEGRNEWLETHEERAETGSKAIYLSLALAIIGLITVWKKNKIQFAVGWMAFISAIASVAISIWIADAGGKIQHVEFRPNTPLYEPPL